MRVPCLTYFRTVQGLSDSEAMKLHGPFCGDELQNLEREFLQTRFQVQSGVINLIERFIRLTAQVFDTADEQSTLPPEFAVNSTFRTAGHLDNPVDGDAFIAAFQKQVRCDFLKPAVSNLSSRPLVRHSSLHLAILSAGKNIFCNPPLESLYQQHFIRPICSHHPELQALQSCHQAARCCTVLYST